MSSYKAYAKINLFLKVTGRRGEYHEIVSRFMLVETLFDTLEFFPKQCDEFLIDGLFDCQTKQNSIYLAYTELLKQTDSSRLKTFFEDHGVRVEKRIPSFAGLGGGSSDAATFLKMCNKRAGLGLSLDELATIGLNIGADVPFFVYGYKSANVSGIGESVEMVEEELLPLEIVTPPIKISTPEVYSEFRKNHYKELSEKESAYLQNLSSTQLLRSLNIDEANDLYTPALALHKELKAYQKSGWFFSGSGSSFFRLKEKELT